MRSIFPLLVSLALLCSLSSAMIHEFTTVSKNNLLAPGKTVPLWTAMYSLTSTPAGSKQPFVSLELSVQRSADYKAKESLHGHAAALIYPRAVAEVGYHDPTDPTKISYCCTAELKAANHCFDVEVGQVIYAKKPLVSYFPIIFGLNQTGLHLNHVVNVTMTDYYFLQISNCGGDALGTLTLNGPATWMNPYGYLPGESYALLPLMGFLALGYLANALYYGFLMFRYRKILLMIQWGVFLVIIVGVIEVSSWYFYRLGINNNGHYAVLGLVVVVFINAVKKMVSRVLVLLVSMGVGTVKWTIGETRNKLAMLSMFYLFFAFLLQLVKEIEAMAKQDVVSNFVNMVIVVSAAILDALFYYWIILSLIRTMQQLTLRRQQLKLDMYKAFFVVIAVAAALSILMVLYVAYLNMTKTVIDWKNAWISDAYWEILYFGLMVAVSFLWRPRNNNTRYSYAEFFEGNEEDNTVTDDNSAVQLETLTVLGGGGDVTKKSRAREETEDGAPSSSSASARKDDEKKPASKLDPAERVRQATAKMTAFEKDIMAFELPSDDEEEGGLSVETQLKKMD